jgi:hypothetical protein
MTTNSFIFEETESLEKWTEYFDEAFFDKNRQSKYQLVRFINKKPKLFKKQLVGMGLIIYIKSSIKKNVKELICDTVPTGLLGIGGNKGAIGVHLKLFESSLFFVNMHLAAGGKKLKERNQNVKKIFSLLNFNLENHDLFSHE